jgi:hypothetical protein
LIKEPKFYYDTDDSTDARTEASDSPSSSDVGALSSHNASSIFDMAPSSEPFQCIPCLEPTSTEPQLWYSEVATDEFVPVLVPIEALEQSVGQWGEYTLDAPLESSGRHKLSSKSAAFQPTGAVQPSASFDKDGQVFETLEAAKTLILDRSQKNIVKVDVVQRASGWGVVIEPDRRSRVSQQAMIQSALDSLMVAAEQSHNVYVKGYCSPTSAIVHKPRGFEATLAVMGSTTAQTQPCWALLKRGTCSQKQGCHKQHPALEVPVRIFIESIKLAAPSQTLYHFKQEAASILMMVVATLTQSFTSTSTAAGAQSFADEDGEGYRVEICIREDDMSMQDHFLSLAKNAITEIVKQASLVHIVGTGDSETPFVPKQNGFAVTFAEMMDPNQACWDTYNKGTCWRESCCRWQHPQCSLPVNVVLKTPKKSGESVALKA